jgi:hypothetical protein
MAHAVDLGFEPFTQGAGRVDAYSAVAQPVGGFMPASLHFGRVDGSLSQWTSQKEIALTNLSNETLVYDLSAGNADWPTGISATVSPAQVVLGTGQSANITLHLTVDTAQVPDLNDAPHTYEGDVSAQTTRGTIRAPFVFAKAPQLVIDYPDGSPWVVMVHDRNGKRIDLPWSPGQEVNLFVPQGSYDVITVFDDGATVVVKEEVEVSEKSEITVTKAEAVHEVQFVPRDEEGERLEGRNWWRVIRYQESNDWVSIGWNLEIPGYYGNLSPDYHIEWNETGAFHGRQEAVPDNATQYFIKEYQIGLTESITMSNQALNLQPIEMNYHLPDSISSFYEAVLDVDLTVPTDTWWNAYRAFPTSKITAPFRRTLYFERLSSYPYAFNFYRFHGVQSLDASGWPYFPSEIYHTQFLRMNEAGHLQSYRWGVITPTVTATNAKWHIGLSPAMWNGKFNNQAQRIRVEPALGWEYYLFLNQYDDILNNQTFPFTLEGEYAVQSLFSHSIREIAVPPGIYTMTMTQPDTFVASRQELLPAIISTFDTRLTDANPPDIAFFQLQVDGTPNSTLEYGERATIIMEIQDNDALEGVSLEWQALNDTHWESLPVSQEGNQWEASLPTYLTAGDYSIRLTATDREGNKTVYRSPLAWQINEPMTVTAPTSITISSHITGTVRTAHLLSASVMPLTTTQPITYTWQASGQSPITHNTGLADSVSWSWEITGSQTITVTADNGLGVVTDTHQIIIADAPSAPEIMQLFLPLVSR